LFFVFYLLLVDTRRKKKNIDQCFRNSKNQFLKELMIVIILIEDRRFHKHFGNDVFSISRAILNNTKRNKRLQGASTIEQLLCRCVLDFSSNKYHRKIQELCYSSYLNFRFEKHQIMTVFLEKYKFNSQTIGILNFCKKNSYDINSLSKNDLFEIASRIKYPNISEKNIIRYLKRVRTCEIKYNSQING
jgi:membrane carboxypeptidase/penicillin-binding protein